MNINKKIKNAKVINIGSSIAYYGFKYENNDNGVNLAHVPQYLEFDFKYIKKYAKYIGPQTKVLIVLGDFVFTTSEKMGKQILPQYYIDFLPWELEGAKLNESLKAYGFWVKSKIVVRQGNLYNTEMTDCEKVTFLEKLKNSWKNDLGIKEFALEELNQEIWNNIEKNKRLVMQIINQVKNRGAIPVIVIPPNTEILNLSIPAFFWQKILYNPIKEIQKETMLLDYMWDRRFSNLCCYKDGFCLNSASARKFTQIVLNDIGLGV